MIGFEPDVILIDKIVKEVKQEQKTEEKIGTIVPHKGHTLYDMN